MITLHALIRWLERIEGIDLTKAKKEMRELGYIDFSDAGVLRYLEEWWRIDIQAIRDKILSNEVRAGMALGATRISFGGVMLCFKRTYGNTVLATIKV